MNVHVRHARRFRNHETEGPFQHQLSLNGFESIGDGATLGEIRRRARRFVGRRFSGASVGAKALPFVFLLRVLILLLGKQSLKISLGPFSLGHREN